MTTIALFSYDHINEKPTITLDQARLKMEHYKKTFCRGARRGMRDYKRNYK